jgi:hypothetical protein
MAKINKTQTYAIRWLHSQGKNNETIASELDITTKQVGSVIDKYTTSSTETTESQLDTKKSPVSKAKDLMIKETSAKRSRNVMIMTKEASELGDEMKKKMRNHSARPDENVIFRPQNNQ